MCLNGILHDYDYPVLPLFSGCYTIYSPYIAVCNQPVFKYYSLLSGLQPLYSTAVEVGVPKLGNCLEMYTCAEASAQFVHSMCTSLDTPCTLEVYTCLGTGLGTCTFPSSFQAWALQLLLQCRASTL